MKNKVNCFCDVETTGLDENIHGIWNIAFILEYDGQILEELSIKMNPETPIDLSAFKNEIPNIKSFEFTENVVPKINMFLDDCTNKYGKLHFIAYNSKFDSKFVRALLTKFKLRWDNYFYSNDLCVMQLAGWKLKPIRASIESFKLSEVCKLFEIEFDDSEAHDALYDIEKTIELYFKLIE